MGEYLNIGKLSAQSKIGGKLRGALKGEDRKEIPTKIFLSSNSIKNLTEGNVKCIAYWKGNSKKTHLMVVFLSISFQY